MMYSEFVEGTGCRDNDKNYAIFQGFEMVYMNSDISKEEIYKMAKNVVNNDLTEEQKKHNENVQREIDELVEHIEIMQDNLNYTNYGSKELIKYYKSEIRTSKERIKDLRKCFYK